MIQSTALQVSIFCCLVAVPAPALALELALGAAAEQGARYAGFEAHATLQISFAHAEQAPREAFATQSGGGRVPDNEREMRAVSEPPPQVRTTRLGPTDLARRATAVLTQTADTRSSDVGSSEVRSSDVRSSHARSSDVRSSHARSSRARALGSATRQPGGLPRAAAPRIDDRFLRSLMAACTGEYRAALEQLSALSGRARSSAWLPALRVRGGRNTDETLRLTPTDAEPDRYQLVGGDGYRLEGQLSWDFSRLIFANEELAVERLRRTLDKERVDRQQQAMEALGAWLAAWVHLRDERQLPEERLQAWVKERATRARLDWLSQGWFSRRFGPHTVSEAD